MADKERTIQELQQALEKGDQLNQQETQRLALYIKQNEERKKSLDYLEEEIKNLEQQQKFVNAISEEKRRVVESEQIDLEIQNKRGELLKRAILTQAEGRDITEEELKILIQIEKQIDKNNERSKEIQSAKGQGRKLANLLGIDESQKDSLTYQLFKNPNQVFDGFKAEIEDAGGLTNAVFTSIAMKIQEVGAAILLLSKQQMILADTSVSSFYAATGATEAYTESIYAVARGNTAMGIGFAESGKAMTALYDGLNTFTNLSKSSQQELAVTTAKLEKLGISGADTAKSIATLSQMMNVSETQAAKTVEEFAAMGQAIGVSSKQMISDFAGVKDQLGVFGSEMNKVFKDLAAQSKATGVAVSDLLNLANKFDTFSSAADSVGKLNAILGGPYLSTMAMIQATDPTERIDMLRQAVNNAGVAFDEMSYYEQKAIMEAGGFKSVEEAQRVLSMSAGAYANELENQRASQEELNKAIQRSIPIQEKLQLLMANFAIVIEPVVTGLSWVVSNIAEFIDKYPKLGTVLSLIILAFGALIVVLPIGIMLLGQLATIFSTFGVAGPAAAAGAEAAAAGVVSASTALSAASPAIVAASTGLGILALVLLAVGAAALMVGAAIALVIYSIVLLVREGTKAPEIFLNMAAGLLALAIATTAFTNPLAVFGMAKMIASVYGLALAINSLESDKVLNFRIMMEKIVEVSEPDTAAQFTQFKEDFKAVAKATTDLKITEMKTFSTMLNATQNLSQNLQLKQDIKVLIDSQAVAARIEKKQGTSLLQER